MLQALTHYTKSIHGMISQRHVKDQSLGTTPICVLSNPGLLANFAGTFVSYDGEMFQDSAAMLDGSYDWQHYKESPD